ncbi:MAG: FAD-binding dehydrogenase, partial [Jatrophihabitantaceae bacterium]
QAFWSFGGLFFVDSPEQRRLRIKDSVDLAWQDWQATAAFDRLDDEDVWPRRWAEAYVHFAAGEQRAWLHQRGVRWFPVVGWAERGGYTATGHGNSVPRFHITWGTGPGLVAPFAARAEQAAARGQLRLAFRHQVDALTMTGGVVDGVRGTVLAPSDVARAAPSSRDAIGDFELHAPAVLVTSGGIGANFDLVRANWPKRMGEPPEHMIAGVPDFVDGRMIAITEAAGGRVVNRDRMWHYVEGVRNYDPVWTNHGIRILPGPSSVWLDATGKRLPVPLFPGFDTLGTLEHIMTTGHDHTWFVLTKKIIGKEFGLSGQEQNPDLTSKSVRQVIDRARADMPPPVRAFLERGADFVQAETLDELIEKMNKLTDSALLDPDTVRREILARDRELDNPYTKDLQVAAMRQARAYLPDRITRIAAPHKLTDPKAGPMIAVRLSILTRKTLGGLNTDLDSRVLGASGEPIPGLYAAGEVAGFGGGGVHGYRSLEGTFLGGCIFGGRAAGRAAANAVR